MLDEVHDHANRRHFGLVRNCPPASRTATSEGALVGAKV
jgi:hypothetical protein